MDLNIVEIENDLCRPYRLLDISTDNEHFIFQFLEFDKQQSEYSIVHGGVTGRFGIFYSGQGMNCEFPCDITMGNVKDFLTDFKERYVEVCGQAKMANYGTIDRSSLLISFCSNGQCEMSGLFMNENSAYTDGISFSWKIDQTYFVDVINTMEIFFEEVCRIQGHAYCY